MPPKPTAKADVKPTDEAKPAADDAKADVKPTDEAKGQAEFADVRVRAKVDCYVPRKPGGVHHIFHKRGSIVTVRCPIKDGAPVLPRWAGDANKPLAEKKISPAVSPGYSGDLGDDD